MLPEAFLERLAWQLPPARRAAVEAAFAAPRATSFRVNPLRGGTPEGVATELAALGLAPHPVPWHAGAFWVAPEERAALLASPAYAEGRLYVQNLSSMVPPLALAPAPGERVLDLCAAPGSKTLQLAAAVGPEGEVAAVEVVRPRFFKLRDNLAAHGAAHVRTFLQDGTRVWRYRPEHFDRVLVDAPCSSEGRFHASEPESYAFWSPRKVKEMAHKQQRLLFSAVQSLRVGGVLVYATCSLAPEENEAVVDRALRRFGEALVVEPLPVEVPEAEPACLHWQGRAFAPALAHAARLWPSTRHEGFFIARLRKVASTLP